MSFFFKFILLLQAYRDYALHERGVTKPQLLCCHSAHAAFAKACEFFNIEYVAVGTDANRASSDAFSTETSTYFLRNWIDFTERMDVKAARRAINSNTIAVVASAPCFPHGVRDSIVPEHKTLYVELTFERLDRLSTRFPSSLLWRSRMVLACMSIIALVVFCCHTSIKSAP
jgi:hypothetical protein